MIPALTGIADKRDAKELVPCDTDFVELALADLAACERLIFDVVVCALGKLLHEESCTRNRMRFFWWVETSELAILSVPGASER